MRHKCLFTLSFCSVFIIILSSIIVSSLTEKGPIILWNWQRNNMGKLMHIWLPLICKLKAVIVYHRKILRFWITLKLIFNYKISEKIQNWEDNITSAQERYSQELLFRNYRWDKKMKTKDINHHNNLKNSKILEYRCQKQSKK